MLPPTAQRSGGFTLLELLVVLVIISIMATFVTVTVGNNPIKDLEHEARKIQALVTLAQQESLLSRREMAIDFDRDGYSFWVREELDAVDPGDISVDAAKIGVADELVDQEATAPGQKWVELEDDETLRSRRLPENIGMTITVDNELIDDDPSEGASAVRVHIYSSGEMASFELNLTLEDGPSYVLTGDMVGNLTLEGPN